MIGDARTSPRRPRSRAAELLPTLGVLLLAAGCATDDAARAGRSAAAAGDPASPAAAPPERPADATDAADRPTEHPALRVLARARAAESRRPRPAVAPGEIPGVASAGLEPVARDDTAAREPLDEALDDLAADASRGPALDFPEPGPDERRDAVRLYTAGRAARLAGDLDAALGLLRESARLDPSAAHPWREIGLVHRARGDRFAAETAFGRAIDRDPADTRSLEEAAFLATGASARAAAAPLLVRLYRRSDADADPALEYVVPARLGRVLLDRGRLAAAAELLERAGDMPDVFAGATNRVAELNEVFRARAELLTLAGDAHLRLGEPERAGSAYERALALPGARPAALLPRIVAAELAAGRPAHAASRLVARVLRDPRSVSTTDAELLAFIGERGGLERELDAAFDAMTASPDAEDPAARAALLRLRAASVSAASAVAAYTESLEAGGRFDADLAADLLGAATDAAEASRLADRLAAAAPLRARELAPAAVAAGHPAARLIPDASPADLAAGPAALRAHLLLLAGRTADAAALTERRAGGPDASAADHLARADVVRRLDGAAASRRVLEVVTASRTAPAALLLEAARRSVEDADPRRAATLLETASGRAGLPDFVRAELLALDAYVAQSAGEPDRAGSLARRAIELDPMHEPAHELRIALHGPTGPLADGAALAAALDDLRRAVPNSRVLRRLIARDAIVRGEHADARRRLGELLDERPLDADALRLLVQLADRADGATRDAVAERIEADFALVPGSETHAASLAAVRAATEPNTAINALRAWLDARPGDDEASLRLEAIYRESAERADLANAVRRERLRRAAPTASVAMELVVVDASERAYADAADHARDAIDRIDDPARLADTAGRVMLAAARSAVNRRGDPEAAAELVGLLAREVPGLPKAAHDAHITLRARLPIDEAAARDVVRDAARDREDTDDALADAVALLAIELSRGVVLTNDPETRPDRPNLEDDERAARLEVAARVALDAARAVEDGSGPWSRLAIIAVRNAMTAAVVFDDPRAPAARLLEDVARLILESPSGDAALRHGGRILLASNRNRNADPRFARGLDAAASVYAQSISDTLHTLDRDPLADAFARRALALDPENYYSANNLSYRLLRRNESLDEAVELAAAAARVADRDHPGGAPVFVLDTYGYALYKAGRVHDARDPDTGELEPGAVSVLERAADLASRGDQYTTMVVRTVVLDHLADALWVAGERASAVDAWRAVLRIGEETIRIVERRGEVGGQTVSRTDLAEVRSHVDAAREKIAAAGEDRPPPVSKVHRDVNSPPAPAPADADDPEETEARDVPVWDDDAGVRTYRVKPGDTLPKIATATLRDGTRWPEIVELNPGLTERNLHEQETIRIPPQ